MAEEKTHSNHLTGGAVSTRQVGPSPEVSDRNDDPPANPAPPSGSGEAPEQQTPVGGDTRNYTAGSEEQYVPSTDNSGLYDRERREAD